MTHQKNVKMVGIYKITSLLQTDRLGISIYEALNTQMGKIYSLKKIAVSQLDTQSENSKSQQMVTKISKISLIRNQISLLKKLNSDKFIKCYHLLKTKNSCYFVYDQQPRLTLKQVVEYTERTKQNPDISKKVRQAFSEGGLLTQLQVSIQKKISIILQIVEALQQMHAIGIIHGGLCLQNIYLSRGDNQIDDERIKVTIGGLYSGFQTQSDLQTNTVTSIKDLHQLDKIMGTLINVEGKGKDSLNSVKAQKWTNFFKQLHDERDQKWITAAKIKQKIETFAMTLFMVQHELGQESPYFINYNGNSCFKSQTTQDCCPNTERIESSEDHTLSRRSDNVEVRNRDRQVSFPFIQRKNTDSSVKQTKDLRKNQLLYSFDLKVERSKSQSTPSQDSQFNDIQKNIRIAFRVCMFAIVNKQAVLASHLMRITKRMIQRFQQVILCFKRTSTDQNFLVELFKKLKKSQNTYQELKKRKPESNYIEDDIFLSRKSSDSNSLSMGGRLEKFCRSTLKTFEKHQDRNILVNGCLLLKFYDTFDLQIASKLEECIVDTMNNQKARIEFSDVDELKSILKKRGQKEESSNTVSKKQISDKTNRLFLI